METIGTAAQRAAQTDLSLPVTRPSTTLEEPPLVRPTTEAEAKRLRDWADSPDDAVVPASPQQIIKHLRYLSTVLPTRKTDIDEGKLRLAVYVSLLEGFPNDGFVYMSRRACAELEWFPAPRQCLDYLKDFQQPVNGRKTTAGRLAEDYWQDRFNDFRSTLKRGEGTPELLIGVPDQWKRICVEQGFLTWAKDRGFEIAVRYRPENMKG